MKQVLKQKVEEAEETRCINGQLPFQQELRAKYKAKIQTNRKRKESKTKEYLTKLTIGSVLLCYTKN